MRLPRVLPPRILIPSLLTLLALAVFLQVRDHDFINFDDPKYIYENPYIRAGLTKAGLVWAFTTVHEANWHPLTWLSHMADADLFGLSPGGHHLVNGFLHLLSSILLFLALFRMTGKPWHSGFVAALFAVHPLHVESVAWAAERKDVLSACFWMLALWTYAEYAGRGGTGRYLLLLTFLALGLMAKPMLVTFPFVLLLLDHWPLRRGLPFHRLVTEKIPFMTLALGSCIVTYLAQKGSGAIPPEDILPFGARVANAALSYVGYLGKTVWPSSLAVFYPHPWRSPAGIPSWEVAGAIVVLAMISFLSVRWATRRPYLVVGWLWYVGTLVPVIGLVQVGGQSMADRYTYLPLIGIFIVIAWGASDLTAGWRKQQPALGVAAVAALVLLTAAARVQAGYWKNSIALFGHTLEVTSYNALAHFNLGTALAGEGKTEEAISHYREALRVNPAYLDARYNLANALERTGKIGEAMANYQQVLRMRPRMVEAHNNLGISLAQTGRVEEAIHHFREALRIDPGNADANRNLGIALQNRRETLSNPPGN